MSGGGISNAAQVGTVGLFMVLTIAESGLKVDYYHPARSRSPKSRLQRNIRLPCRPRYAWIRVTHRGPSKGVAKKFSRAEEEWPNSLARN